MERPLLFLERVLYGDGQDAFNGVFAIRIKGNISEQGLKNALRKIQAKYPELRAAIVTWGKNMPWFKIRPQGNAMALEVMEREDDDQWMDLVKASLAFVFDAKKGPLARLQWLKGTDYSELILTFHHCICDGRGGVLIISDLLALLDDPARDIGRIAGFTALADILPAALRASKRQRFRISLISKVVKAALWLSNLFISSGNKPKISRKDDYLLHKKLTKETSSRLFEACSQKGVTINTVLGLAFLLAFKGVRSERAFNKITCPVDIRRFVPALDKEGLFSFGLVMTLQVKKSGSQHFWDLATALQQDAERQMKRMKPFDFLMLMECLHPALGNMIKSLTYGKVANDAMFSNMGRLAIPSQYRGFEVDTIFSPVVIGPFANPTTVITSTYKGQLDLSFVSNDGYMEIAEARQVLDAALGLLLTAVNGTG